MKRAFLWFALLPALAGAHEAAPGDLLVVETTHLCTRPRLIAFGKAWPVHRMSRCRWQGLIGVDLAVKPGRYALVWKTEGKTRRESIHVVKRRFRISRIRVPQRLARFDKATLARIRREARMLRGCAQQMAQGWPAPLLQQPVQGVISTPFGARRIVNGEARSPHAGVDIAAPLGTPIRAPAAGTVVLVLHKGYLVGNAICLAHGGGMVSVFMHLAEVFVQQGAHVQAGDILGTVGATGRATGPHLHWGLFLRGARIDPLGALARRAWRTPAATTKMREPQAKEG